MRTTIDIDDALMHKAMRLSGLTTKKAVVEPKPPYGIMRWHKMFADEETLFEFGRESLEAAERLVRERKEIRDNKVKKLQSGKTATK